MATEPITVYLAGPVFSLAEREFNVRFAALLRRQLDPCRIILPQEEAARIFADPQVASGDKFSEIHKSCLTGIEESNFVVAILDGPDVDSGTCVELGHARRKGRTHIIGVRTDPRVSEEKGLNLMVSRSCHDLVLKKDASMEEVARAVAEKINSRRERGDQASGSSC